MTDEELIAELRRVGPLLLRRDGDDVARYGGGLLKELADRLEGRAALLDYQVPPVTALRAYMAATGWDQDGPAGFAGAIWRNGEAAIGVPHDDFDQLMIRGVISRVARKEGRSEWDVARDVVAVSRDGSGPASV